MLRGRIFHPLFFFAKKTDPIIDNSSSMVENGTHPVQIGVRFPLLFFVREKNKYYNERSIKVNIRKSNLKTRTTMTSNCREHISCASLIFIFGNCAATRKEGISMKVSFEWNEKELNCKNCPCVTLCDDGVLCNLTNRNVECYVISEDPRVHNVDYMCPLTRETNEEIFYDDDFIGV